MSVPQEDISLAAEHLSDDEIIVTLFRTVSGLGMNINPDMAKRFEQISKKYEERLPLRRKLEKNKEAAMELISDYPIYASVSGITYEEAIDIAVALNFDPKDVD